MKLFWAVVSPCMVIVDQSYYIKYHCSNCHAVEGHPSVLVKCRILICRGENSVYYSHPLVSVTLHFYGSSPMGVSRLGSEVQPGAGGSSALQRLNRRQKAGTARRVVTTILQNRGWIRRRKLGRIAARQRRWKRSSRIMHVPQCFHGIGMR